MSNIRSFKLITGEELVANVLRTVEGPASKNPSQPEIISYELERPHMMQLQTVATGQVALALVPWTLSNLEDLKSVSVPASAVVTTFEPAAKVQQQYIQQTSSIALPTTTGIIK